MPIHSIDEKPIIRVETNVGGKIVDLEATDYREQEYKRNQQTEPRRKYVMEPLPGTEPEPTPITDDTPVEMTDDLQQAINEDLRKRGVSNKPTTIKPPKPTTEPKL
jgi:hypothetical protein